ncbi:tape measure protein [Phascolarctobacterium faecium]|jgi:tape measure domain-containing protein|uniref:tape measure protein n=2 Tax=Phascolarctobacterium faecium TaxID=33025 RepID=UPI002050DA08|nr:tape measure protein [Phascolarctobacterium faecium]DAL51556.1 MAG TPA_asm: tail tape measure protein [Caudoviricetes sp.]
MATVAELLVKIGADTSDLRKEINATKRQLKSAFGSEGMELSSTVAKGIGASGTALVGLGVYAVKAGGDLQSVQVAMTNLLGSAGKAEGFIKELQNFSAHTPFEFNDVTKASQKFLAFGFTAEQIIPTLTAVGDAAAGVGAGQDGVNRLTLALGQIAAKGKLASGEMMQLTELGIPAWQMLAEKLGTDVAGAQDMVTKRMVDSKTALEALVGGMEASYGGMMEQQSSTILGTWSNLMDGIGQVASQAGLQIADALNLTTVFSSIGDWLSNFATAIEESGISGAIASCVPPEAQLAIVALGTALTAIAIPAMYAAGAAAVAMMAPFLAAIGAAVTACAPFIAAVTAIGTALYAFYQSGLSVSDVLSIMGVESKSLTSAWEQVKSAFSSLGSLISSVLELLKPVFVAFGAVVGVAFLGIMKYIGFLINSFTLMVSAIAYAIDMVCSALNSMAEYISSIISSVCDVFSNMAESVLPDWASKGLGTISNFVDKAISWLSGLIAKITETNEALGSVGGESGGDTSGESESKSTTPKWQAPDFSNFAGSGGGSASVGGASSGGGGRGGSSSGMSQLESKAQSTSKSIEEEWMRTFSTKSALVDRWYKEELDELEKSRTANENYERDKQRLAELYASKRIEALREESRQEMEIYKEVLQAANASALSDASVNSDAASAELLKISQEHETTVQGIEERWQKLADTFLSLNTTQKEAFISALKEQQIAFEETESGQLDFHKQILEDKLNADKAYEEARLEYYTQCKDIQANIDEAYRALDMERLQEVLTEEAAIRLNDMEAQKTMMDTYQEAFLQAHMTTAQLVSDLYSTALGGLSTAFTNILTGAKSAKQAFTELGKSMIKVIAQYFAKQAAGMIVSHVMGQSLQKKEAASSAAMASSALAAWAPVAVAYETVHPGAAARALGSVTGILTSAAALGTTLLATTTGSGGESGGAKIQGYAKGGYFTRPTLGIIGEGVDDEVALPLNRAVFRNIADGIAENGTTQQNTVTQNIYGDINNSGDADSLFQDLSSMVAAGLRGV